MIQNFALFFKTKCEGWFISRDASASVKKVKLLYFWESDKYTRYLYLKCFNVFETEQITHPASGMTYSIRYLCPSLHPKSMDQA